MSYGEVKNERNWSVATGRISGLVGNLEKLTPSPAPEINS
jgi:hypothetical protein